ncbi:hypothetical protein BV25DRAFT_919442 [Artomyces pyxidatus]|uniref:Uncharacterized protein n=1 Tax=Artomyces pyxidatus TaxID=48021 RepID=A0ACB8SWX5_9AGAM|nr:hypothetical protein BV25DRAFT_919442 [Artomyces pyxidatus]
MYFVSLQPNLVGQLYICSLTTARHSRCDVARFVQEYTGRIAHPHTTHRTLVCVLTYTFQAHAAKALLSRHFLSETAPLTSHGRHSKQEAVRYLLSSQKHTSGGWGKHVWTLSERKCQKMRVLPKDDVSRARSSEPPKISKAGSQGLCRT